MVSIATAMPVATAAERWSGAVFIAIHVEAARLRDVVDARPGAWPDALAVAVGNVRRAALDGVGGSGEALVAATPRTIAREAVHSLDACGRGRTASLTSPDSCRAFVVAVSGMSCSPAGS